MTEDEKQHFQKLVIAALEEVKEEQDKEETK